MSGRDAWAYRYEWVGPFSIRVDALEGIVTSLQNAKRLSQLFDHFGVEVAMRARVVKHVKGALR